MLTKVPNSMLETPGTGGEGGGGSVTLPDPVAFRAFLLSSQSLPGMSYQMMPFATSDINIGDHFNGETRWFQPPAGMYRIRASCLISGADVSTGDEFRIAIYKNDIIEKVRYYSAGAAGDQFSITVDGLVEANGSDYFQIYVFFGNFTATTSMLGDPEATFFEGEAITLGGGAKPCFKATLGGTDAVVPADVTTIIPLNTADINVGDYFDTAAHTFTPRAGNYRLSVRGLQLGSTAANEILRISIFKNGVAIASQYSHGTTLGASIPFNLSTVVEAGGTDAFDVRYFSFTLAGTKTIEGDTLYTSFEGEAL